MEKGNKNHVKSVQYIKKQFIMKTMSERQGSRCGKIVRLRKKAGHKWLISHKEREKLAKEVWEEMNRDLIISTDFMHF